jgi:hypothetical protein
MLVPPAVRLIIGIDVIKLLRIFASSVVNVSTSYLHRRAGRTQHLDPFLTCRPATRPS